MPDRPAESVWVVAFRSDKKGISEMYVFPSEAAAKRAKWEWEEWDRRWTSSETAVVYRATLEPR